MRHTERAYRDFSDSDRWRAFRVRVETTDLYIRAAADHSSRVRDLVSRLRGEILAHIAQHRDFLTALAPIARIDTASHIVNSMLDASEAAGVGPMAAVAGAIAAAVGSDLSADSNEVIVENGGDIWLRLASPALVDVYAPGTPFAGRLALRIDPAKTPLGICTSSGRVGPSLSFGRADAATVLATDAALADAVATETGNRARRPEDAGAALEYALGVPGVIGALVVIRDTLAVRGDIELVDPSDDGAR